MEKTYKTKAGADGRWQLVLPPMKAGGPYRMDIVASNKITLNDILVGDVWLCSGQSNMVHQMNIHDVTYAKDIRRSKLSAGKAILDPNPYQPGIRRMISLQAIGTGCRRRCQALL